MKKYKLIKEFPESPKLGTIVQQRPSNPIYYEAYNKVYLKTYVENHPEFWEETIENYEILEFRGNVTKSLYKNTNGVFINSTLFKAKTLQQCLNSCYSIHSVKRLSDGEIFTIGDKTTKGVITKIVLSSSGDCFGIYTDVHNSWNGSATFDKIITPHVIQTISFERGGRQIMVVEQMSDGTTTVQNTEGLWPIIIKDYKRKIQNNEALEAERRRKYEEAEQIVSFDVDGKRFWVNKKKKTITYNGITHSQVWFLHLLCSYSFLSSSHPIGCGFSNLFLMFISQHQLYIK